MIAQKTADETIRDIPNVNTSRKPSPTLRATLLATSLFLLEGLAAEPATECAAADGISLQVLGSGGPIADDDRAGAGYLVWVDGKARAMIDSGSGSVLRFAEAGGRFRDLEFIGISHVHTDHSADLPALLKSGVFSSRERDLTIAGPAGSARFPAFDEWLSGLLDPERGIYRYLSGYLDGTDGLPRLDARTVALDPERVESLYSNDELDLEVAALPVPHGIVPALGFRVTARGKTIVFGSDQTLTNPAFVDFAREADVLVAHMVIPENANSRARQLHARPSAIGRTAGSADVDTLLISHLMARSLRDLDANLAAVSAGYNGRILVADDLACVGLDQAGRGDAGARRYRHRAPQALEFGRGTNSVGADWPKRGPGNR